jgi:hypothetical protein
MTITVAPIKGTPLASETSPARLPYPAATLSEGCRQGSKSALTNSKALSRYREDAVIMNAAVLS